jgi:hypothetical protein
MHYAVAVMLPGTITEDGVEMCLEIQMNRYYYDNTEGNDGEWDWFVVGGRWGGSWILKEGGVNGPLMTEAASYGMRDCGDEHCTRQHTDCARLSELESESIHTPYSWLDLMGEWNTKWLGPEKSGSQEVKDWEIDDATWTERWLSVIQQLPADTWMILVDCHN